MKHALVLFAFAGCYRPSSSVSCEVLCAGEDSTSVECATCIANNPDGSVDDGSQQDDVRPDVSTGPFCYGTGPISPCFDVAPTGTLTFSAVDGPHNTDAECPSPMTFEGREVCVFAANEILVVNKVRFSGTRPLVLLGTFSISFGLGSTLDLSSSVKVGQARLGAGAEPVGGDCSGPTAPGQAVDGSAGGSFATTGGGGGQGTGGETPGAPGNAKPVAVRGGCKGGNSVSNQLGGPGGGAVYLISNALIMQDGLILATGGGGDGGSDGGGGAGGGAGGYIGIDVETVSISGQARLVASGGGGGGGGCMGFGGLAGADATAASTAGGSGADIQPLGDGGAGSFALGEAGKVGVQAEGASCAGGGGGGGVGAIQFFRNHTCVTQCIPKAETIP